MTARVRHKFQTTIYLTAEQDVALQELKERTGRPVAEHIRKAIDEYLMRIKQKENGRG